jgi:hypothetical protein
MFKGSLTRDFRLHFFHESVSPGPLSIPLGPFQIFMTIRGDIHNFVFTTGVVDTGDKLFTVVNDKGDEVLAVLLLPAINCHLCS